MSRSSTRTRISTTRFVPESVRASAPTTKKRASSSLYDKSNKRITLDLGEASSSFVDSNRIATGTLTQIHSESLVPGKVYSIWHKFEKTTDICDPMVGVVAGQFDSKDKYYVRFKGRFVGYDKASTDQGITGISGVSPEFAKLAVFDQVRIISNNKEFFTTDIYLVGKNLNNPNIKLGINVYTLPRLLNPNFNARITPINHTRFRTLFDEHIKNGKGRVAFDMDYWSFANDIATPHSEMITGLHDRYNKFALNSFINPANPNLKATALAMGKIGPNTIVAEYLGLKPSDIQKDIPEEQLSTLGSHFDAYVDLGKKYPRKGSQNDVDLNKEWNGTPYKDSQNEDDGPRSFDVDGGARRKTRTRKRRRNKTRSKRRRSTRSRK
jgi:hypothetical protein